MKLNIRRIGIISFLFVVILIGLYVIKSRLGIDLNPSFSLSHKLPVCLQSYLKFQPKIVYAKETGYLLNDDFESQDVFNQNWTGLWVRESATVTASLARESNRRNSYLKISNTGLKDWSIRNKPQIKVSAGEVFSFSGNVCIKGKARAELSVILFDNNGKVLQWLYGRKTVTATDNWKYVRNSFIIPQGVSFIQFRLTGSGQGEVWFDNIIFGKEPKISVVADKGRYSLEQGRLSFVLDLDNNNMAVTDKKISKVWRFEDFGRDYLIHSVNAVGNDYLDFVVIKLETMVSYKTKVALTNDGELVFEIDGDTGEELNNLDFPPGLMVGKRASVILPFQEGMIVRGDVLTKIGRNVFCHGGGWPMAFVGALDDDGSGWMEIVETPYDHKLRIRSLSTGNLIFSNVWIGEKHKFGYKRKIRFIFFDHGTYVTMAKRYREYAKKAGWLRKLKDKKRKGNIDKLIGAVNVWYWGKGKGAFAKELHKAGIKKVLFSNADWDVWVINGLGYLTSIYDIYQDVWPPVYHNVTKRHDGWPEDLVLLENGDWMKGWTIKRGLREYVGGVINSQRGLERAKKKIPRQLKKTPYTARFIDTTTASPWREDYSREHPLTRTEDVKYKMKLLDFVSNEMGLVTGSENGVDIAVPYTDYFEGMMSLGIGRLLESGRKVSVVSYMKPTENFLKYQVGIEYRIPLWELVFHDCVVATWYWGDSSNRIPEYWWKKDLFNILYGNMPLWAIRDYKHWEQYKDRFIESYNNVCPVFEKVGYAEMLSHRFVTEDHTVQETVFANGVRIVVNFGDEDYKLEDSKQNVPSHGFIVFENDKVWKQGVCSKFPAPKTPRL